MLFVFLVDVCGREVLVQSTKVVSNLDRLVCCLLMRIFSFKDLHKLLKNGLYCSKLASIKNLLCC